MPDKLSILLVEDDEVDVMNVRRAFAKNNVDGKVVVASDGVEALELLRGRELRQRLPRFVILDLNLPRMNGIEFLRELRADEQLSSLIVIVLTTSDEARDVRAAYALNVAGYFVKPIGFKNFIEMIGAVTAYWKQCELPKPGKIVEQ